MGRRIGAIAIVGGVVAVACGIDALGTMEIGPQPEIESGTGGSSSGSNANDASADGEVDAANDGNVGDAGDAGTDAPIVVALCDAGSVHCNGVCILASDCRLCANAKLFCKSTRACASDCAACVGQPIQCFGCDNSQNNPVGTCESTDAGGYCLNANYGSGEHCDCSNTNVANCVGSQHVCLPAGGTDWCVTCGEKGLATNGKACKGGGTCNATKSPPGCE